MTTLPPIRVVIVDPQPVYRTGIRHSFAAFPDLVVAGEAGGCADGMTLCERLRPDLLLLDAAMAGGLELIGALRERGGLAVVVLTERLDEALLSAALQQGVAGYLLKELDAFDIAQAVREAAAGYLALAPSVSAAVLSLMDPRRGLVALSGREQAVLALLLRGLSNEGIARQLCITSSTVKFHLRNIYDKLGVQTRAEAIVASYRQQGAPTARLARAQTEPEQPAGRAWRA